ncbi:MAG: hypothetical protein KatS3mg115_0306 [Candidatus Poribacteria bacterium]|nr:MAG: hypothetical protein KatS3mg115_0306 [Candidatus Poribacteria bacterium]
MKPPKRLEFANVRTLPLAERKNKVHREDLIAPIHPGMSLREWIEALPRQLVAVGFRELVQGLAEVARNGRLFLAMLGGHVIKVGLGPLFVQMVQRGIVNAIALNGAAAIHDFELALIGGTSEDVQAGLENGLFGMAEETGRLMNAAIAGCPEEGFGWALGRMIEQEAFPHREVSVLAAAYRHGVPLTVHVAIGTDIIHQHPTCDGAKLGAATFADFQILAQTVTGLEGGAVVNFGSAVLLPEVFLKALTIVRNLGHPVRRFLAANFDMIQHYRPGENVVRRPTSLGGRGFQITGHHELMIPLLFAALLDALEAPSSDRTPPASP